MTTWRGWTQEQGVEIAYVYMLMCQDSAGAGYIKFGLTQMPDQRLTTIRTGCPLPLKLMAVVQIDCYYRAARVEKALHKKFKGRRATGEWFRFNFSSPEDKREFNDGWQAVFSQHLPSDAFWSKINLKEFDQLQSRRRECARFFARRRRRIHAQLAFTKKSRVRISRPIPIYNSDTAAK